MEHFFKRITKKTLISVILIYFSLLAILTQKNINHLKIRNLNAIPNKWMISLGISLFSIIITIIILSLVYLAGIFLESRIDKKWSMPNYKAFFSTTVMIKYIVQILFIIVELLFSINIPNFIVISTVITGIVMVNTTLHKFRFKEALGFSILHLVILVLVSFA